MLISLKLTIELLQAALGEAEGGAEYWVETGQAGVGRLLEREGWELVGRAPSPHTALPLPALLYRFKPVTYQDRHTAISS